jgi:hypothetical protein
MGSNARRGPGPSPQARPVAEALAFLETLDNDPAVLTPTTTDDAALAVRVADLEVVVARLLERLGAVESQRRRLPT